MNGYLNAEGGAARAGLPGRAVRLKNRSRWHCAWHRLTVAALLLLGVQATHAQAQERLGTIFFSPAERALISASRKGDELSGERNAASIALTGVVSRSDKKGTAWINGRPVAEGEAITASGVPSIGAGRVAIDGKSVRVRETLELESGARGDALPPGAVTVRKAK